MPRISDRDEKDILAILHKNGKGLRLSKPKVNRDKPATGRCAYVWRMVMFSVSRNPKHHCMPVCADFDLCPDDWADRKELLKELDVIVNAEIDKVPKHKWHGVHRWGRALGHI